MLLNGISPASPVLKDILVADGWAVTREDSYNWLLEKDDYDPLSIPKRIKLVPFEIHEHCLGVAKMDLGRYWQRMAEVGYKH